VLLLLLPVTSRRRNNVMISADLSRTAGEDEKEPKEEPLPPAFSRPRGLLLNKDCDDDDKDALIHGDDDVAAARHRALGCNDMAVCCGWAVGGTVFFCCFGGGGFIFLRLRL
jgi:hypothetical protein